MMHTHWGSHATPITLIRVESVRHEGSTDKAKGTCKRPRAEKDCLEGLR
jgi:hypothetical protein